MPTILNPCYEFYYSPVSQILPKILKPILSKKWPYFLNSIEPPLQSTDRGAGKEGFSDRFGGSFKHSPGQDPDIKKMFGSCNVQKILIVA